MASHSVCLGLGAAIALTLAASLGCSRATLGDVGTSAGDAGGGGVGGSGSGGTTPDVLVWGTVMLGHVLQVGEYGYEQLSLSAAFYGEAYDPEELQWGYVDTLQTPDGVTCDIYYQSGMMEDPPPEPPPQLDGGRFTAGTGSDLLEIAFDGEYYAVDWRTPTSSDSPMPGWLTSGAVVFTFTGDGKAPVAPLSQGETLPGFPTILAPPPTEPVPSLPNGNYLIAWQPTVADELSVRLHFNLDWDNSVFDCHPPSGVTQLELPADWISTWTWGYGELMVVARNRSDVLAGQAAVSLRATRLTQTSLYFDIW